MTLLPEERTLLLVDVSNVMMKAIAVNNLSSGGKFTGGLYGFTTMVASCINTIKPDVVILAKDSPPYYRDKQVESYKGTRKAAKEKSPEMAEKIATTKELLAGLFEVFPATVWEAPGLEADDMIAHAFMELRHRFDRIVVMSNDSDLYQLFDHPGARLEFWKAKSKPVYDREAFKIEFQGITGEQHLRLQAMTGGHNGLKGIPRFSKKTGLQRLAGPGHWILTMREWGHIIWGNLQLMRLPHLRIRLYQRNLKLQEHTGDSKEVLSYLFRHGIKPSPSIDLAIRHMLGK